MKIALGLHDMTDSQIQQKLRDVAKGLTDHAADFAGASPTAAELVAGADAIQAALSYESNKQQEAIAATLAKNGAVAAGAGLLNDLASWTEANQKDPAKAGNVFPLKKSPTQTSSIGQVQGLALSFGNNPGELEADWLPVAKAKSYEIQCCYPSQPNPVWTHLDGVSGSKATLKGLTSAATVQIRVRAIGPKNLKGPWSDLSQHLVP